MRGRYAALCLLSLAAGAAGGVALERARTTDDDGAAGPEGPKVLYWVAPMDPNFRRDEPGKSPMGMDLVPVYEGEEPAGNPAEVRLSPLEIAAIGVRTAVARVEPVARRIETVGFVGYDEHRTSHIHTRVEGWIDRLSVRAVGDRAARGDLLFTLYAPEITVASSELLRAERRADAAEIARTRLKLRNYGVTDAQIDEMAAAGEPAQFLRVHAPRDGVVTALAAADGMFLKPETRAMTLADLSSVWLLVDVFERDAGLVTETGWRVRARFEHLPGRTFEGEIDYVYPELDARTRTLPVRLRFDNREGLLRPNMFGAATLEPEAAREAVTVPGEAVIRTGRAERVILKTGEGTFLPRLVTTGPGGDFGAGGRTEIVQGLAPGEEVVASAQFLIDSESALGAGLARLAPTEAEPAHGTGVLAAVDAARRSVAIRHREIDALGWPALETRFAARADVALDGLEPGAEVEFSVVRGADGLLALTALGADDGIAATGAGILHAVTADGWLTVEHEPIPELGWPAMRMDLPASGFDPAGAPLGEPVAFDLAAAGDGLYAIVAVRRAGDGAAGAEDGAAAAADAPAKRRMTAVGTINRVDAAARSANVTHGPLAEIGMPGMTMDFALAPGLAPESLPVGAEARLTLEQEADLSLTLVAVETGPAP